MLHQHPRDPTDGSPQRAAPVAVARADSGYEWVVPHHYMRKTTGTAVNRAPDQEATKDQLGHASTRVADDHDVEKLQQGRRATLR